MGWETAGAQANSIPADDKSVQRRSSTRFDLDMSLVARPRQSRSRVIQGRIIDLSCTGIRAVIAAELQVGDFLELEFGLPYTPSVVRLDATIRWRQYYQYGLEFMRVIASDREKINHTCVALDLLR